MLEINGKSMVGERHDTAVQCIQQKPDIVNLVTERILLNNPKEVSPTTTFMQPIQVDFFVLLCQSAGVTLQICVRFYVTNLVIE